MIENLLNQHTGHSWPIALKQTIQRQCFICGIFKPHGIIENGRQQYLDGWYYERNLKLEHISVCPKCARELEV